MDKISILVVDDHPMMREALLIALEEESDMEVIAEATDGLQGVSLYKEKRPDVVLMDLLLPGIDGIQATAQIFETDPQAKIMVVTSMEDEDNILAAIQSGALGYFPKTAPRVYLLEAIRKIADGIPYMPSGITIKLFKRLREMKTPEYASPTPESITPRQGQILALLGEGRSDAEISEFLHIGEATVRTHVHNIIHRLGLETRSQAVAYTNRQGKQESGVSDL